MGAACSCCPVNLVHRRKRRPHAKLSELQSFDLVLIRTKAQANSFPLDERVAKGVKFSVNGTKVPQRREEVYVPRYDRIGLIQLPFGDDPEDYSHDNIQLIEAGETSVRSKSLRDVYEGALEVVIRPLLVGDHNTRKKAIRLRKSKAQTVEYEQIQEDEKQARADMKTNYYRFAGPVINKPYMSCVNKLGHMLAWAKGNIRECSLSDKEAVAMENILGKFVTKKGIAFPSLLGILHDIVDSPDLDSTFSDAEIFDIVQLFGGNPESHIKKKDFMAIWHYSFRRTVGSRKRWRSLISGGFVSMALMRIGVVEENDELFWPMDFANVPPSMREFDPNQGRAPEHFVGAELGQELYVPPPIFSRDEDGNMA